tara:strand:+ start:1002 stop:1592 length:591 start_codon:yes stop_codon:yes gene_type:complete
MKNHLIENIKAERINLAESYNRLFGNTKRQLLEYARDTKDGKELDKYFDKLVPSQGKSGTLNGEIVRAVNRIGYRWYNDGDKFYQGYGTETAAPAMAFLRRHNEIDPQIQDAFKKLEKAVVGTTTDKQYEKFLEGLFKYAVRHVEMIPTTKSDVDLFDYKADYMEEEENEWDDDEEDGWNEFGDEEDDEFDNEEQY